MATVREIGDIENYWIYNQYEKRFNGKILVRTGEWSGEERGKYIHKDTVDEFFNDSAAIESKLLEMREEAIKRGVAQYNPQTGHFEWIS